MVAHYLRIGVNNRILALTRAREAVLMDEDSVRVMNPRLDQSPFREINQLARAKTVEVNIETIVENKDPTPEDIRRRRTRRIEVTEASIPITDERFFVVARALLRLSLSAEDHAGHTKLERLLSTLESTTGRAKIGGALRNFFLDQVNDRCTTEKAIELLGAYVEASKSEPSEVVHDRKQRRQKMQPSRGTVVLASLGRVLKSWLGRATSA